MHINHYRRGDGGQEALVFQRRRHDRGCVSSLPLERKPLFTPTTSCVAHARGCDAWRLLCILLANHLPLRAGRHRPLHHGKSHRRLPLRLGRVRSIPFDARPHTIPTLVRSQSSFLVRYDAGKLCERMQPDDYMKGVLYFYSDFFMVCCGCLFLGCLGSAAS